MRTIEEIQKDIKKYYKSRNRAFKILTDTYNWKKDSYGWDYGEIFEKEKYVSKQKFNVNFTVIRVVTNLYGIIVERPNGWSPDNVDGYISYKEIKCFENISKYYQLLKEESDYYFSKEVEE